MNEIVCKRYVKNVSDTDSFGSNEECFIGFKTVREPSSLEPGQFTMVELRRIIADGKVGNWSERQLEGPYLANGVETIPMSAKDKESQYVSQLLNQGYTFLDEVLVNAETQIVLDQGEAPSSQTTSLGSLNWLLSPPGDKVEVPLLQDLLIEVFAKGAALIGFTIERNEGSNERLPSVLMRTETGFELKADPGQRENTFHPTILEGAGELSPEHGHKPLLMLVYLQQQFADTFSNVDKELVAFCDERGDSFTYKHFDSLKPLISRFGFDYDEVRADAERLGLASELIRLSEIDTDEEDHFF